MHHITVNGQTVDYTLRRSRRARRLRVAVYADGKVVVTAPERLEMHTIERFVGDKAEWLLSKLRYFSEHPPKTALSFGDKKYAEHKEAARALVEARVTHFAEQYGFRYNAIAIKNHRSRWGSCSIKGNLNFNFRILFLPSHMQDYIIVHELCHLKELNHSKKFWMLVETILPNHREIRNELKQLNVRFS